MSNTLVQWRKYISRANCKILYNLKQPAIIFIIFKELICAQLHSSTCNWCCIWSVMYLTAWEMIYNFVRVYWYGITALYEQLFRVFFTRFNGLCCSQYSLYCVLTVYWQWRRANFTLCSLKSWVMVIVYCLPGFYYPIVSEKEIKI